MRKRLAGRGYIGAIIIALVDALIIALFARDIKLAICTNLMFLCLVGIYCFFIAESLCSLQMKAVSVDKLGAATSQRLYKLLGEVECEARRVSTALPSKLTLCIVPSQEINAYALGRHRVALSEGALQLDSGTLKALLAHELGHVADGHCFESQLMLVNSLFLGLGLFISKWITMLFVFILVFCGGAIGSGFGFLTFIITKKALELASRVGDMYNLIIMKLYTIISGFFSRSMELDADTFAVECGYGATLKLFLQRFGDTSKSSKSLLEALYCSHPDKYKRLANIENAMRAQVASKSIFNMDFSSLCSSLSKFMQRAAQYKEATLYWLRSRLRSAEYTIKAAFDEFRYRLRLGKSRAPAKNVLPTPAEVHRARRH